LSQPENSAEMSDWIRRGGRFAVPDETDVDDAQPTGAALAGLADGGARGGEIPPNPDTQLDHAIRDAFARSPKRL
jgi:hypothetical protein